MNHLLTDDETEKLAPMQSRLQARQRELAELLLAEKISRKQYVEELDTALQEAGYIGEKLLGGNKFREIFGEFRIYNLMDINVFLGEEK